jgi:hypothetical protein
MDLKDLNKLGIGLSRLLRYSYGGFLLLLFASIFETSDTKKVMEAIPTTLTVLVVIGIGSAIYALHRSVIICYILSSTASTIRN